MARKKPAEIEDPVKITPNQIIAYNLTEARGLRGWTQEEAAAKLEPYVGARWSKATFSSAERSIDVKRASGLRWASVSVWAPTPQPTSSTRLPAGYAVSECSRSTSVPAWSCSRALSRAS